MHLRSVFEGCSTGRLLGVGCTNNVLVNCVDLAMQHASDFPNLLRLESGCVMATVFRQEILVYGWTLLHPLGSSIPETKTTVNRQHLQCPNLTRLRPTILAGQQSLLHSHTEQCMRSALEPMFRDELRGLPTCWGTETGCFGLRIVEPETGLFPCKQEHAIVNLLLCPPHIPCKTTSSIPMQTGVANECEPQ